MSLAKREGKWYWKNWLGLMQSPYKEKKKEDKDWRERYHGE